jgi:RND superfamily putative drug exporter
MKSGKSVEETLFFCWGFWLATHKKWVLLFWTCLILFSAVMAPRFMNSLTTTELYVYDSEAKQAQNLIDREFPTTFFEQDLIVVDSDIYTFDDQEFKERIADVANVAASIKGVESVVIPGTANPMSQALISKDRQTALVILNVTGDEQNVERVTTQLSNKLAKAKANKESFSTFVTGNTPLKQALIESNGKDVASAEAKGLPIAFIVLLIAFGSLIAAGLPIVLSMLGLITTFGILGVVSIFHPFDTTVSGIAPMIGLGIGIDYILFLVRRFKEELEAGRSASEAVAYMMATTGKAIFFSGLTVMVSMAGLFWLESDVFFNIAVATMVVVVCMMLVSLMLLPAILAALGHRIHWLRIFFWRKNQSEKPVEKRFWYRWSQWVVRRPLGFFLAGTLILVFLSAQAFDLKLGMDTGVDSLNDQLAGQGMALVQEKFSSGLLSPVRIVLKKKSGTLDDQDWQQIATLSNRIAAEKEAYRVDSLPSVLSMVGMPVTAQNVEKLLSSPQSKLVQSIWNADRDGDVTIITVTMRHASDSQEAADWIHRLRDEILPQALKDSSLKSYIGGMTMSIVELSDETMNKTPIVIVSVLILSYFLLMIAFRSWLIPLKAILLNVLSVGASYGLLVWVFIGGNGAWLGVEQVEFVQVFLPVIAFTILFGLSMDYEVFLVGRIKEEWGVTRDAKQAIVRGIAYTSGPITQAGLIMIAVFASFFLTKSMDTKQIGFGLGTAILIDVTIVRGMLLPAIMSWMGERAWAIPKWLDRWLPRVDLSELPPKKD